MTPSTPDESPRPAAERRSDSTFDRGVPLGNWFGVRVRAHWSVAVMVLLFATILAGTDLPKARPHESTAVYWSTAIAAAAALIVTLLAHELAHAVTARRYGIRVKSITLWVLGGFTELDGEAPRPRAEGLIALAGPLTSLGIAAACIGLGWALPAGLIAYALVWVGVVNLFLAVFNALPAAPLDGGRVLKAIIWWRTQDRARATEGAARAGQVLGILLAAGGALEFLAGGADGLWLALVGWFIYSGAASERLTARSQLLRGVLARDVMHRDPLVVPQWWTVRTLLELLSAEHTWQRVFPTVDFEGKCVGAVTADLLHRAGPSAADQQLRELARRRVLMIAPDAPVAELILPLRFSGGVAIVVEDGRPVGLVSDDDLLHAMRLRELGWQRPTANAS